jgi:predicted metalloprotease with PDZ domain
MEGFTTYYDELLLVRAGYTDDTDYLQKLQGTVNYVEGSVGARVQPVAHASFDAWIKAYRPNENSSNTTMTYYSRGQMLAALIDVMIVSKYDGKKCLDHFLQQLYNKYYKKLNRGFSEQEFKTELEELLGENFDGFFAKYVNGTDIAPLSETFAKVGVQVTEIGLPRASFGAGLRQDGGKTIVRSIRAGSAAEFVHGLLRLDPSNMAGAAAIHGVKKYLQWRADPNKIRADTFNKIKDLSDRKKLLNGETVKN